MNNDSPFCLLTGSPGLLESHLSPALGNVWVLFKEPHAPCQCNTAFFWPSSLENRPPLELCFHRCAGAVSSMLVQFYSQQFGQRRREGNGERYVQNFSHLSGLLQQRLQDHLSPDLPVTAEAHLRTDNCNINRAASGAVRRSELKQPNERLSLLPPQKQPSKLLRITCLAAYFVPCMHVRSLQWDNSLTSCPCQSSRGVRGHC